METIKITEYDPVFQPEVDEMMTMIQAEYTEAITTRHSTVIKDVYSLPDQRFWIALSSTDLVAGTVGLSLQKHYAEIKRMFVHPDFRGPMHPTAALLLKTAIDQAGVLGFKKIYLGTMAQFAAAQRFYEKSGFSRIGSGDLPDDYHRNPMDSIFYYREIGL